MQNLDGSKLVCADSAEVVNRFFLDRCACAESKRVRERDLVCAEFEVVSLRIEGAVHRKRRSGQAKPPHSKVGREHLLSRYSPIPCFL